jgi:excisionase family DNA binding protein
MDKGKRKREVIKEEGICNQLPSPSRKRLYTMKQAGEYLGRSYWAIRELVWEGKLPYVRDGRAIFLDVKDLDDYVEKNKTIYQF